jgi:hypothetical protein
MTPRKTVQVGVVLTIALALATGVIAYALIADPPIRAFQRACLLVAFAGIGALAVIAGTGTYRVRRRLN